MSLPVPEQISQSSSTDQYKTLVVVLTIVTTVITAVVAGLQADANIRATVSNRSSQLYAILAAEELHRQSLQSTYDINILANYLQDSQEANILKLTALEQQQQGDLQGSMASQQQAAVAQARADTARKFSILYTDSRYAPSTADGIPNFQAYLDNLYSPANDLVAKQNAAADEYNRWNRKGDSYTSILATLAVSLFLFGLAQALSPRLRLILAIFGILTVIGAGLWAGIILLA